MKQTDTREIGLVKGLADKALKQYGMEQTHSPYMEPEEGLQSYWMLRKPEQNEMGIGVYDFDTPVELKKMLEQALREDYKAEFIVPVTAAAFKRRGESAAEGNVSAYIYEF